MSQPLPCRYASGVSHTKRSVCPERACLASRSHVHFWGVRVHVEKRGAAPHARLGAAVTVRPHQAWRGAFLVGWISWLRPGRRGLRGAWMALCPCVWGFHFKQRPRLVASVCRQNTSQSEAVSVRWTCDVGPRCGPGPAPSGHPPRLAALFPQTGWDSASSGWRQRTESPAYEKPSVYQQSTFALSRAKFGTNEQDHSKHFGVVKYETERSLFLTVTD